MSKEKILIKILIKINKIFREHINNYELKGMLLYWGTEYFTLLKKYDGEISYWILYNNSFTIKYNDYKELIEKCLRLHLHPVLLFYKKIPKEVKAHDSKCFLQDEEMLQLLKFAEFFDEKNDLIYKSNIFDRYRLRPDYTEKDLEKDEEIDFGKLKDYQEIKKTKFKVKNDDDYEKEFQEEMNRFGKFIQNLFKIFLYFLHIFRG